MSIFCEIPSSSRLSSPWRFVSPLSAMITSGPHLPETTSKTFLEAHPGSSTQCEWASAVLSTVLLDNFSVNMILRSKYL
jgi:hypothetical protein